MPKMKTKSGAKKRFKLTASGLIKRHKAGRRHILTSKDRKRKRNLRADTVVSNADHQSILRVLALR